MTGLPEWFQPHLERRDRPGYVKEGRTNPELLARGARGQHRASVRRQAREAGTRWVAANLASLTARLAKGRKLDEARAR